MGRAGRQGDPGSGRLILSLEDDLLSKYLAPVALDSLRHGSSPQRLRLGAFSYAQFFSERQGARNRLRVLQSDLWLDENLAIGGNSQGG